MRKNNKGWQNLKPEENSFARYDPERLREISRKGAEACNKVKQEKRSAKAALEKILSMSATDELINNSELPEELAKRLKTAFPDATINDLLQCIAVGNAVGKGDMRALEFIRDTVDGRPTNKLDVQAETETITENDRRLLEKVAARLENEEMDLCIVKDVTK
jgi:hypothetical protein